MAWEWWLGLAAAASVLLCVAAFFIVPMIVVRLDPDYFVRSSRGRATWRRLHPVPGGVLVALKNAVGAFLVIAGLVMLLTPGQGVITILVGMSLMNYPGKYRLERWFITRRPVWNTISWMRRRAGADPLEHPDGAGGASADT